MSNKLQWELEGDILTASGVYEYEIHNFLQENLPTRFGLELGSDRPAYIYATVREAMHAAQDYEDSLSPKPKKSYLSKEKLEGKLKSNSGDSYRLIFELLDCFEEES